jgi:hypothetical protein
MKQQASTGCRDVPERSLVDGRLMRPLLVAWHNPFRVSAGQRRCLVRRPATYALLESSVEPAAGTPDAGYERPHRKITTRRKD